jgi:16S rRNA (cytosine1402-N4)-methyltransferase
MKNNHVPVMLNEIKSFLTSNKKINVLDATFGGGGYSKAILENYDVKKLIAIDRDPIAKIFAEELSKKYSNFFFINSCFGQLDKLILDIDNIRNTKFDFIIFDLGVSSNQIDNSERGFSFTNDGPLDMGMGLNKKKVSDIINSFSEEDLANIIFKYGEERYSRRIAKNIVLARKSKKIETTKELAKLVNSCFKKNFANKSKINPATKTFQAFRIYVNDELDEVSKALNSSIDLLKNNGKLIIVSFQSLEDRIVKDFLNHNSGKRWRSSRHYPELADEGSITLNLITKKPIRPTEHEIFTNSRSRSAKLRVGEKIN